MVDFSPDVLAWKQFLLPKFGGWTKDYLCAFSELFNSLYTCHHQLSAYFSRKYLLDLVNQISTSYAKRKCMKFENAAQNTKLKFYRGNGAPRKNAPSMSTMQSVQSSSRGSVYLNQKSISLDETPVHESDVKSANITKIHLHRSTPIDLAWWHNDDARLVSHSNPI